MISLQLPATPIEGLSRSAWIAVLITTSVAPAQELLQSSVLLDDVIPPSSPIAVTLVCGDNPSAETTADEQGHFQLALPPRSVDRNQCRLEASAVGYESDSTTLDRLPRNPDIGGLVLKRAGRWNGYALSVTSLAATPHAAQLFGEAVQALRRGGQAEMARAEEGFAQAAKADPSFAEAWFQLGRMRLSRQDSTAARDALHKALAADPWYTNPYRPLLLLELAEERWESVVKISTQMLDLNPYLADIRYHRAVSNVELEKVEAASADAKTIAEGPGGASFALRHHLDGLIFERQGNLAEAGEAYRRYLAMSPRGAVAEEVRQRLASIEKP